MQTIREFELPDEMGKYPLEYIAVICDADRHTKAAVEAAKWGVCRSENDQEEEGPCLDF